MPIPRSIPILALASLLPACIEADPDAFDQQDFAADATDDADAAGSDGGDASSGGPSPAALCEPAEARLVTEDGHNAGAVTVTTVEDGVLIDVETSGRWRLEAIQAFAGTDAPPREGTTLAPEQFPHAMVLEQDRSFTFRVPFDAMGVGTCGESVTVAIHAELVQERNGEILQQAVAWAEADGASWGSGFEAMICCE